MNADEHAREQEADLPTTGIMRLAEWAGAFDFWLEDGEQICTLNDGKPV